MKTRQYIILGMAATLLSSCVKDTLYNTPHPDKGAVTLSLAEGGNYVMDIDGRTADVDGTPFTHPDLLEPGTHSLLVYNRAEGFSFDGRTAQVNAPDGASRADGIGIIPLPGYLYTDCRQIDVAADDTLFVRPEPRQRVRDLYLELTITEGRPELIQTAEATLSGVAGAFDMEAAQTTGQPLTTSFGFTRQDDKLNAHLRLLGTLGTEQALTVFIAFTDDGRTQHTEIDLTEALADFNNDMTTGYQVKGNLQTPIGMEEGTGDIIGWNDVTGGDIEAN
ncbi:hypothetical protein [uncultured Bacteroides sp.]|uniref:hypothetical protein n=1 Tax=uncultured Bacteroides sp. TaxID=162156 RepID=UPI00262DE241|nr:hypothetical protein [uncultured Bacteroides sp.]